MTKVVNHLCQIRIVHRAQQRVLHIEPFDPLNKSNGCNRGADGSRLSYYYGWYL